MQFYCYFTVIFFLSKIKINFKRIHFLNSPKLVTYNFRSYQAQIQENADKRNRLRDEINQKIRQLEINHNEHQTTINDLEQVYQVFFFSRNIL